MTLPISCFFIEIQRICSSKIATFQYDLDVKEFVYDKHQCGHKCCLNADNLETTGELFCGYEVNITFKKYRTFFEDADGKCINNRRSG